MNVTPAVVADEHEWCRGRAPEIVALINDTRTRLGTEFGTAVDDVTVGQYESAVDAVFGDGDLAVNVAALVRLLRDLDVESDYPGFVVDELLGRELAGMIAGNQPLRLLAEATFHYADVHTHPDGDGSAERTVRGTGAAPADADASADTEDFDAPAGADDLDAALAAGFQTRLPGWEWRESPSPFSAGTN